MTILHNIKHWLQTKIYHAWLNIENERETEKIKDLRSRSKDLHVAKGHFINGAQYMQLGENCCFGRNSWVECIDKWKGQTFKPSLVIGKNFSMQYNCHIGCIKKIEIGDNVLLGSKVYITDHYHGEITREALSLPPGDRPLWGKPVKIGNNVWIGDNVCIMPGVTIGDNVIVGANAVVTHCFPANTVIAGVPAKIIKRLDE